MKLIVMGDPLRAAKYRPDTEFSRRVEMAVCPRGASEEEVLQVGGDADFLLADAISPVRGTLIGRMPRLKLIHSEGVAYNAIDCEAARKQGIYVCNCKGVNAGAVAEQAVLLMLGLLRDVVAGDKAVREGRQIQVKEKGMVEGIRELGDCQVGIYGLGDIGKATARRLAAFGCRILYYSRRRAGAAEEAALGVQWVSREELLAESDLLSLHVPVTPETEGMVDGAFLAAMKPGAYLINTSRGELMDHEAVRQALLTGQLAGAGMDTLYPEPVTADNPLASLPLDCPGRLILSPHVGGITAGTFTRAHRMVWENLERVARGERPEHVVNGL